MSNHDAVNSPKHYTQHPSGVECIDIIEHWPANLANAVKYIWRHGLKGSTHAKTIQDLEKARWYITREIERRNTLAARHAEYTINKQARVSPKEAAELYDEHVKRYG